MKNPEPVVKWAGGKRQLLDRIIGRAPAQYNHYFEPFLGGGAVLFNLQPPKMTVNDINSALMSLYQRIRTDPEGIIDAVNAIDGALPREKEPASEYFYTLRSRYNDLIRKQDYGLESDALMLFLNKHCFNGLYRVNAKGEFNVPYNGSTAPSLNEDNIYAVSRMLQGATLLNVDFEQACRDAGRGDFVFLDSPYAPIKADSFQDYTKEGFHKEDHERLAVLFKDLDKRGCFVMLTNHDTRLIRDLYKDYRIEVVSVRRAINTDASKRRGTEVIVTNYLGAPNDES